MIRGAELVDFEKVNSLEGVFIANRFEDENTRVQNRIINKNSGVSQTTSGSREFSEADIEAQTI